MLIYIKVECLYILNFWDLTNLKCVYILSFKIVHWNAWGQSVRRKHEAFSDKANKSCGWRQQLCRFEQQLKPAADIVAVASENNHTSFWDHGPSFALPISTPLSRYCYIRHRADDSKCSYLSWTMSEGSDIAWKVKY